MHMYMKNVLLAIYLLIECGMLMLGRAFHTCSDLLGDLVILPLYPTDQKSKIAAKYTASDGGSKSAQLAHVPDRKQASQADSEPPYEEVY